ncbi:TOPRIM nucleotidyl transferase/hydrolase domain-containing protein [Xylanimonas sp. McL0601]|uniref:TOPRIM nucleotidyl transferase/hydrolase domain-containing protein n=1 Tax=Xylanimonas sp. McL0601 TaxID=3414739 RepID=UPI003CE989BB
MITVLVEGASDAAAVTVLAARRGLDLPARGVCVVATGGAGNLPRAVAAAVARGDEVRGLYDLGEARFVARALGTTADGAAALAAAGFHACDRDLEDELIRALTPDGVLAVVGANGDLGRFATFTAQPQHRDEPISDRLHRFLGTTAGRKERYARLLAAALPDAVEPPPIAALLDGLAR